MRSLPLCGQKDHPVLSEVPGDGKFEGRTQTFSEKIQKYSENGRRMDRIEVSEFQFTGQPEGAPV